MQGFFLFFFVGATVFFIFSRKYSNNRKLRRALFSENCYKEVIFFALARAFFLQMLKSSASTVTKVILPGGASISLLTLLNELLLNPHLAFPLMRHTRTLDSTYWTDWR